MFEESKMKEDEFSSISNMVRKIGSDFWRLTYSDSFHISDLGLRKSLAPQNFYVQSLNKSDNKKYFMELVQKEIKIDNAMSKIRDRNGTLIKDEVFMTDFRDVEEIDSDSAAQILCCYVNMLGSWDDGYNLSKVLKNKVESFTSCDRTAYLLTLMGNINAAFEDKECREMYQAAYNMWHSPYEKFSTVLRMATSEIKRLKNYNEGARILETAKGIAYDSSKDRHLYLGMIYNLTALSLLKQKIPEESSRYSKLAYEEVRKIDISDLSIASTVAGRYMVQITLNFGLTHANIGNWSDSLVYFSEAQAIARNYSKESLVECSMLKALALSKLNRPKDSIHDLEEALDLANKMTYLSQREQLIKLLSVAYYDVGRHSDANRIFSTIRTGI